MSTRRPETRVSEATFKRIRDYAVSEPSFTNAFAAWELGLSFGCVSMAVNQLHADGIIKEIEPRSGPYGAVYAYDPPKAGRAAALGRSRHFAELDESRRLGVGSEAPTRGVVIPHVRPEGPSGKPGRDKARSARGVQVKRARQGT
jgi:hypothetical protein